jgi:Tol biopolymer transport system component
MNTKIVKLVLPLFFLLLFSLCGCQCGTKEPDKGPRIGWPRFSFDNDKIVFAYFKGEDSHVGEKVVYEISRHKLYKYNGIPYYHDFSLDGKKKTYSTGKNDDRNIFVSNADGSDEKQLTRDYNIDRKASDVKWNTMASFSPDGKRIIFKKSGIRYSRPMGGTGISDWDVYEVDIKTGKERRLTAYRFYSMTEPYYLSDGKRFVFSGHGPHNNTGVGPKDTKEYEKLYQGNEIFIMDGKNNTLQPAFTNGEHSFRPMVSWNDTIIFLSMTNKMDGLPLHSSNYDLFIYKRGKMTRLTKMESYIFDASISADGLRAVFLADKWSHDARPPLWIVNTDGTGLKKIEIPWEQLEQPKEGAGGRSK